MNKQRFKGFKINRVHFGIHLGIFMASLMPFAPFAFSDAIHPAFEAYVKEKPVAVIFSPTIADPRAFEQIDAFRSAETALHDHELALVIILGDAVLARGMRRVNAQSIRESFEIEQDDLSILLIGRSGAELQRWYDFVPVEDILETLENSQAIDTPLGDNTPNDTILDISVEQ